jgi:hypothetical protein
MNCEAEWAAVGLFLRGKGAFMVVKFKSTLRFRIILGAALTLTGGCASYRQRISDDLRDTFKADAGIGIGLYAQAKATSFLDAGVGWGGYWENIGLESRYTDLMHPVINGCTFPLGVIPGAIPDESPLTALRMANVRDTIRSDLPGEYAVAGQLLDFRALNWSAYGVGKRCGHQILHSSEPAFTDHPFGFEAGVGALIVDVRVGFDPVEFCDLICTAFGYDLLKDNPPKQ